MTAYDSQPPNIPPFDTPEVRAALAALKVVPMPVGRNFPPRKPLERVPEGTKIPRARNPWILYRSDILTMMNEEAAAAGKGGKRLKPQAGLSRDIAADWHNETPDVRDYYQYLSEIEKIEHKALYPNYKFAPKTKEERELIKAEERRVAEAAKEHDRLTKLAEKRARGPKARRPRPSPPRPQPRLIADGATGIPSVLRPSSPPIEDVKLQIQPPQLYSNQQATTSQSSLSHPTSSSSAARQERVRKASGMVAVTHFEPARPSAPPRTFGEATSRMTSWAPQSRQASSSSAPSAEQDQPQPAPQAFAEQPAFDFTANLRQDIDPQAFLASWEQNFMPTQSSAESSPPTDEELSRQYLFGNVFSNFGGDYTDGPTIEINAPLDLNFTQAAAPSSDTSRQMQEPSFLDMLSSTNSTGQPLLASLTPTKLPFAFDLSLQSRPELEQVIEANGGAQEVVVRWGRWMEAFGGVNEAKIFYAELQARYQGRTNIFDLPTNRLREYAEDVRTAPPGTQPLSGAEWALAKGYVQNDADPSAAFLSRDFGAEYMAATAVLDAGSFAASDFLNIGATDMSQYLTDPSILAGFSFDQTQQQPHLQQSTTQLENGSGDSWQQYTQQPSGVWGQVQPSVPSLTGSGAPTPGWNAPTPAESYYSSHPSNGWAQEPSTPSHPQRSNSGSSSDEEDYSRPRNYTGPIDVLAACEQVRTASSSSSGTTRGMPAPQPSQASRSYAPPSGASSSTRRVGGSWIIPGVREAMKAKATAPASSASRVSVDTSMREVDSCQYDLQRESLLAGQRSVFSASYATDPSAGLVAVPVPARSASSGAVMNHGPFGPMKLMRNDANSPYLYAPSPEEVSPMEYGHSYQ